ncbi:Mycolic acid cyclopropane synthetase-domain-containing protein [Zopfochytrium polystomum]|nr:Mycolic acid cyclopropane synthetase-domain-containing protein [Zopfochytrium polystomum]
MKAGHIRVTVLPGGGTVGTYDFGDTSETAVRRAVVKVRKDTFWLRLMVHSALGFGEAYMFGEVEVDDLAGLLVLFVMNREYFAEMNLLPAGLNSLINKALHSQIPNTIYNSLYNIQAHYDLGNEMFAAFLDPTMTYSCPIWDLEHAKDDSLEAAQYRKIHAILDRAVIRKGDHVLEIGTGWGALSIEAVRRHDCQVTTLTLSSEQKALAEERIAEAGLSHRITVLLKDYRDLDPTEYQFDRIVTVEMLEAVGPEFLPLFFEQAQRLLKPRGVLALQVITMPDARYKNYLSKMDFIQKYIFPGGHCPSVTALVDAVFKGTGGKLIVDEIVNIGPHYVKALRIWREKFVERFDDVVKETGLAHVYTPEFRRKWEFYFAYCEAGFASRTLGDVQMRLTKEANFDLLEGIPF